MKTQPKIMLERPPGGWWTFMCAFYWAKLGLEKGLF